MPVPVFLDFVPPNDLPDITKLHVYEGATPDGPFNEIEVVVGVGAQGSYLSSHTTPNAVSQDDWFTIRWENAAGVFTPYADAVQGGTRSVVADLVSRVMLRDPSAIEEVAAQEAEAVVEQLYGITNPDPTTVSKRKLSGMTLLVLARMQLTSLATSNSISNSSWTAGLVSLKSSSDSAQSLVSVQGLLKEAARLLGMSMSVVAQICVPEIAGGLSEIVSADISRLQIEVD